MKEEAKKIRNTKIVAISLLAAIISIEGVSCINDHIPYENDLLITSDEESKEEQVTDILQPGEHILLIPLDIKTNSKENIQLDYHEGYTLEGINIDNSTRVAIYSNNELVEVKSTGIDENGNPIYGEFGKVLYSKGRVTDEDTEYITYQPGEHILAVAIPKMEVENYQIEYHEGYEPVDVAAYTFGRYYQYGGGYIVYQNTTKVKCRKNNDGSCTHFGTPRGKEKINKI